MAPNLIGATDSPRTTAYLGPMTAHSLFDITGRIALVTGSSRGIGRALARGLVEAGARVVLNGRDEARLDQTRREFAALRAGDVHTAAFDVTDEGAVAAGVDRIASEVGPVEILVNNTGLQLRAPIVDFTLADWQRLLDANLTSAFLMSREVAPAMIAAGRGKIVNICSVQSQLVRPAIAPYAATKGGLALLTKGLCADLAPHGICVNGLAPGYFDTELTSALVADAEFTAWVARRTPLGRWGATADLVGTLLWLSSPASDFVTGQIVYVDGGMTAVL